MWAWTGGYKTWCSFPDSEYQIKIPITSSHKDEDKVQILFKKLAGGEDEELIGKIEDSLGNFKNKSQNYVTS